MRRISRKDRWVVWSLCLAMTFASGALLVPALKADAPADTLRGQSGVDAGSRSAKTPARGTQPRIAAAKTPAKGAAKAAKKAKRPAQRSSMRATAARRQTTRVVARAKKTSEEQADVATGPDEACHLQLRAAGVSFVKVIAERAPGVRLPIRLTGPVSGVEIRGTGKKSTHYLDCRLALALVRWSPQLNAAGVTRVDHYSIYRPDAAVGATNKLSGHALALAIDAARFHLRDGRVLTVLDTWTDKTKGAEPCRPRSQQSADEHLLRQLVCDAAQSGIFQTIVTPHHNADHDNHVHLEVSGRLAPTWIH